MHEQLTPDQARAALDTVAHSRRNIIKEIGVPGWYWWFVALGWVVLGVITDLHHPWLTSGATLVFGAAHSMIAPRVIDGRHRTRQLSVSAELAGRRISQLVIGGLIALALVTIGASLAAGADGARHPVTEASIFVAAVVLLGGPHLPGLVRGRAARAQER